MIFTLNQPTDKLRIGALLLHTNEGLYYGHKPPRHHAHTILVACIKRIKYIQDASAHIDKLLATWETLSFEDPKTQRKLWYLIQDAKASPLVLDRETKKLKKYHEHFAKTSLPKKGTIARFILDGFEQYCLNNQVSRPENLDRFLHEGISNGFGGQTPLKRNIQWFIEQQMPVQQDKLHKLLLAKQASFHFLLQNETIQSLQKILNTPVLQDFYNHISQNELQDFNIWLTLKEVEDFVKKLEELILSFEAGLKWLNQLIEKSARNKTYTPETQMLDWGFVSDNILVNLWNGSMNTTNLQGYINTIIIKRTATPTTRYEKIVDDDEDEEQEEDFSQEQETTPLDEPAILPNEEEHNEPIPINLKAFFTEEEIKKHIIEDILKELDLLTLPFDEKRQKDKGVNVALSFLEYLGNYEQVVTNIYGELSKQHYDSARKAKEEGKKKLIQQNSVFNQWFKAIESYSYKR